MQIKQLVTYPQILLYSAIKRDFNLRHVIRLQELYPNDRGEVCFKTGFFNLMYTSLVSDQLFFKLLL